jgi:hypothetical protein
MHATFQSENLKRRGHFGDIGVDEWIILKWFFGKYGARVCTGFM